MLLSMSLGHLSLIIPQLIKNNFSRKEPQTQQSIKISWAVL